MTDTAIIGEQLKVLAGTVANRYRPRWFRQALNVQTVIPSWARVGQYTRVDAYSDIKLASNFDNTFPLASHKRAELTFSVLGFINGYRIMREEVQRAAQDPGYQLDSTLAQANQRKAEHTLHTVALWGGGFGDVKGILTLADPAAAFHVPTDNATTGETSLVDSAGDLLSFTDVDEATAYAIGLIDEMLAAYKDKAGDDIDPDRCIVPRTQSKAMRGLRDSNYVNAWKLIQAEFPGIQFFESDEADGADGVGYDGSDRLGGAGTCRYAMWNSDEDIATMVVPEEYHDLDAYNEPVGSIVVPSVMRTGGVISKNSNGVLLTEVTIPSA